MLINKGARVNATNMGDDTALHLGNCLKFNFIIIRLIFNIFKIIIASAHGHRECVQFLLKHKSNVNAQNEHGNSPLHYALFWNYQSIGELLIMHGALVNLCNKFDETPLDKCKVQIAERLIELAQEYHQNVETRIPFKDLNWSSKSRSKDSTLSRHSGIPIEDLHLQEKIASTQSGDTWIGVWQNNKIVAKFLNLGEEPSEDVVRRATRSFTDEYPKLRIFSHPNILPIIGCTNDSPNLITVSQYMEYGSLYHVLHEQNRLVIDYSQALKFAIDICRGMAFLHTLDLNSIERFYLNSRHIYVNIFIFLNSNSLWIDF